MGSVVSSQPAVYIGGKSNGEQASLTAIIVSVPNLHLAMSIHAEPLRSVARGCDRGCWSSHGNARSSVRNLSHVRRKNGLFLVAEKCVVYARTNIVSDYQLNVPLL